MNDDDLNGIFGDFEADSGDDAQEILSGDDALASTVGDALPGVEGALPGDGGDLSQSEGVDVAHPGDVELPPGVEPADLDGVDGADVAEPGDPDGVDVAQSDDVELPPGVEPTDLDGADDGNGEADADGNEDADGEDEADGAEGNGNAEGAAVSGGHLGARGFGFNMPFLPSGGGMAPPPGKNIPFLPGAPNPGFQLYDKEGTPLPAGGINPYDTYEHYKEHFELVQAEGPQPIGWNEDGVPVYKEMPDLTRVDGPFIAPVQHWGPGFSSWTYAEFPEAGAERDAMLADVERQTMSEINANRFIQDMETRELELRHLDNLGELNKLQHEQRMQDILHQQTEMNLARIENMTVDQYRTVNDMKLDRIGPEYDNLFRNPNTGEIWKIDLYGNAYRQTDL